MKLRQSSALLFAGAAFLSSCGSETSSSTALFSADGPTVTTTEFALDFDWPPTRGVAYPDVTLLDHRGEEVQLSSFKGKVILVETVGMT